MYTSTKAIVLRNIRYAEADLIAKCYTLSDGLKSYMLKGVLKTKKGRIKATMFQPFTVLELEARHRNKGGLEYIKEAKIAAMNPSIRMSVEKTSMAMFLSEVIQNAIQEEEQNIELFNFLEISIRQLEKQEQIANFHLYFLVEFTKYLGIYPDQPKENSTYFNLSTGHFGLYESDKYSISGNNTELLKRLMNLPIDEVEQLRLNREIRRNFLNFILSYYQIQLQGFHQPKSLGVLNQLFTT